jgi:hypothetical protein
MQGAARRINEFLQAQRGNPICHTAPSRILIDGDPGERRFEKMHVRIRALRQPSEAILNKAAERMGIRLLESGAQRHGVRPPAVRFAERVVAACISKQGEGLVVQVEARIADAAVQIDHRHDRRVRGGEMLVEIVERVALRLAPGAVPAEPTSFAIRERLAGDSSRAVRSRQCPAVEADRLVEATFNVVRALVPP